MEFNPNNKYKVFGRVDSFNTSDGIINMCVTLEDNSQINIKVMIDNDIELAHVYLLEFECKFNGTRNHLILSKYTNIFDCKLGSDVYRVLERFYAYVPVGIPALEEKLDYYLSQIKNPNLALLTKDIFERYRHDFLLYPAAVKMHHNYIGGLAYHTLTMCDVAARFIGLYDSIDPDYLISGVLLHDISKVVEFAGPQESEYSTRGQLIGHLVLGAIEVDETAKRLGIGDSEEVMVIEHMIISHHGNPQFGAAKRPVTPDALLLWMIDTIDSKMRVIDEVFAKMEPGTWSDGIGVLDRLKFYKKK